MASKITRLEPEDPAAVMAASARAAISVPESAEDGAARLTGLEGAARALAELAAGRDPWAGPKGSVPPDWTTRRWALRELLDRAVGKSRSHVHVTGGVALTSAGLAEHSMSSVLDSTDVRDALSPGELAVLRKARRAGIDAAKQKLAALENKARSARSADKRLRAEALDAEYSEGSGR